jgi:type VI secretion system secreted protein VgrG
VKVHFHWDRYDKSDKNSSCWVRVSQPWAGKGWGGYFIPRIGQEVIVDFLNGDPDRPIIVGRVYNDDQPKPFDSHTQSGFRTRSTPKGSAANCNEFRFDDKKGSEQVYLHAEKNLDSEVEADETRDVGHDRITKIHNNETLEVDADRKTHVKGHFSETIDSGEDRTVHAGFDEKIDGGEKRKVDGGMKETVNGGMDQTINGGEKRVVNGGMNEVVNGGVDQTINGGEFRTVTGGLTETVTGALTQTVLGATKITSTGPVTITAPAGFTVIAPGGSKFIDQFFDKTGATYSYKYGVVFGVVGAKVESGVMNQGNFAVKMDASVVKIEQRAFYAQTLGISMGTKATTLETAGASIYSRIFTMYS